MPAVRPIFMKALCLAPILLAACATPSTIETRRAERSAAYESLAPEQKSMVDTGQVRIGMSSDAVYIAWGKPSEVLESEDPSGHFTTWRYYGSFMQENRYWAYREANGSRRGEVYLERYLTSDYNSRDYVRSEIVFKDGKVLSWRTLPRPTQ